MGVLKRKEERSAMIQVRVPASVKGQLEELRRAADDAGFDLGATITETITRLVKQIHDELGGNLPRVGDAKRATRKDRSDRIEQGLSANGIEA